MIDIVRHGMPVALAIVAGVTTYMGGLIALRLAKHMTVVMGLTAGLVRGALSSIFFQRRLRPARNRGD
jgi:hypothetical protein